MFEKLAGEMLQEDRQETGHVPTIKLTADGFKTVRKWQRANTSLRETVDRLILIADFALEEVRSKSRKHTSINE